MWLLSRIASMLLLSIACHAAALNTHVISRTCTRILWCRSKLEHRTALLLMAERRKTSGKASSQSAAKGFGVRPPRKDACSTTDGFSITIPFLGITQGQFDQAVVAKVAATKRDPDNPKCWMELGSLLVKGREYGDAERIFRAGAKRFGVGKIHSELSIRCSWSRDVANEATVKEREAKDIKRPHTSAAHGNLPLRESSPACIGYRVMRCWSPLHALSVVTPPLTITRCATFLDGIACGRVNSRFRGGKVVAPRECTMMLPLWVIT